MSNQSYQVGTIIRVTGNLNKVLSQDHEVIDVILPGKLRLQESDTTNPIAVGDRITFSKEKDLAVVREILPRENYIIRKATKSSSYRHILCANISQAVLVVTIDFPFTPTGFIDRFLVMAGAFHIPVTLIFNKIDLFTKKKHSSKLNLLSDIYESIGYKVLRISALDIDKSRSELLPIFQDKITFLSGYSGSGKSSIANIIEPTLFIKTSNISKSSMKGKHTTTFAEMHPLSIGGFIIDAPGIREFDLLELEPGEISHYFPEMLNYLHDCKFHNCTHINEPDCAVLNAFDNDEIALSRYKNYYKMVEFSKTEKTRY